MDFSEEDTMVSSATWKERVGTQNSKDLNANL
jgi:hypothetical protein